MTKRINQKMQKLLKEVENVIKDIEKEGLQDEQETLDFMDKLNELSVTF